MMFDQMPKHEKLTTPSDMKLNVERVRAMFPVLQRDVAGRPLVYLDNASTTQKPRTVIEALTNFYSHHNANVHRGVHRLSSEATELYESARERIGRFLGVSDRKEIVYVRGTTEAINLVAQSFGRPRLSSNSEVLVTQMEHHSNLVPWQTVCQQTGATLRVVPMRDNGELDLEAFDRLLGPKTKILSVAHVSNTLGTVNPVSELIDKARGFGARVVIDGAQAVPHMPVDVIDLDCDFYAFSGHKVFGPTGIGILYGKRELLEEMQPYQTGGDMIRTVTLDHTSFNALPYKFEAGTPHISGAVGLAAAVDFLEGLGWKKICQHEESLLKYADSSLNSVPGLRKIGSTGNKRAVISFVVDGVHPHDIGTILDEEGVAIRAGHHCTQPLMEFFGVPATARVSLSVYNTNHEVDRLIEALERVREFLG